MIKWNLETYPIKDLKKYPKNARNLSKQQHQHLKISIAKFGLADKPVLNKDKTIIGGHQRIKIMKDLGHLDVECWVPEIQLDEKEVEEFNIRLNKNSGTFDYDILANEFDALELLEWGFSEENLVGKLNDVEDVKSKEESKKKKKQTMCPSCGHEF